MAAGASASAASAVEVSATAATLPAPPMLARQCSCGAVHTEAEWFANPTRRDWPFEDVVLEIAECGSCGSTMSLDVTESRRGADMARCQSHDDADEDGMPPACGELATAVTTEYVPREQTDRTVLLCEAHARHTRATTEIGAAS